jgi:hypothetical protein
MQILRPQSGAQNDTVGQPFSAASLARFPPPSRAALRPETGGLPNRAGVFSPETLPLTWHGRPARARVVRRPAGAAGAWPEWPCHVRRKHVSRALDPPHGGRRLSGEPCSCFDSRRRKKSLHRRVHKEHRGRCEEPELPVLGIQDSELNIQDSGFKTTIQNSSFKTTWDRAIVASIPTCSFPVLVSSLRPLCPGGEPSLCSRRTADPSPQSRTPSLEFRSPSPQPPEPSALTWGMTYLSHPPSAARLAVYGVRQLAADPGPARKPAEAKPVARYRTP